MFGSPSLMVWNHNLYLLQRSWRWAPFKMPAGTGKKIFKNYLSRSSNQIHRAMCCFEPMWKRQRAMNGCCWAGHPMRPQFAKKCFMHRQRLRWRTSLARLTSKRRCMLRQRYGSMSWELTVFSCVFTNLRIAVANSNCDIKTERVFFNVWLNLFWWK